LVSPPDRIVYKHFYPSVLFSNEASHLCAAQFLADRYVAWHVATRKPACDGTAFRFLNVFTKNKDIA
jgi:hypothetical protein